ncbi:hypothetical protein FHS18_003611 [Paenibacillus phyllosphaerae]|uniref:Alpha-L-rhamnosidase n=1 Tax=Paenibacillus phyllosphaerae TaxID=274593 RepID=A0A7W5AZA8_9BACL|nr:glycosyl hydrolase [Paenibacillus phyllosphaerae]MBB3111543.1 hypothetical protein [Paenibacillus phyllosphaerae]
MRHQPKYAQPSSAYRIQPFWFWNGEMDDRELERQIREMADKGLGGFFLCPRQGLQIPYLSDNWFEKVRFVTDLAAKRNLEVWLYDEYPYPSGIAGGEVLLHHPDAKHKLLAHRSVPISGGGQAQLDLPWGQVLYAKAVPISPATGAPVWEEAVDLRSRVGNIQTEQVFQKTGLTAYNNKRFFTYNPQKQLRWLAPAGSGPWEVHAFVEEDVSDFKYYGTFVDPLHKDAMRTFIELTHQRYADTLGDRMPSTVKGMFTDETGLLGHLPWSPVIAGYMKEKFGTDLHEQLPALLYDMGDQSAKVRYQYYQAIHELLRDNYHRQVHDWCEAHNLQYIAEVPSVRMSTQRYSHIPGLDSAHEKLGRSLEWILDRYAHSFRYNPKMMTSLARQLGRERVLVECFHSVGWSMTLQDAKWMIDRLAALGVNMFNFHAFYYTTDGLTKHDAPPSQFLQNPYWPHFGLLADYTARLSVLMSEGRMKTDLAVLYPTASIWAHMGNPFHEFRYCGEDQEEARRLQQLKDDWHAMCKMLTLHQRDYDHLDSEILAEAQVDQGRIRLGQAEYSVLILPPMSALESEAWDVIRRFAESGGTVIAVGLLPYQTIDARTGVEEETLAWFGAERPTSRTYWADSAAEQELPRIVDRQIGRGRAYWIEAQHGLKDNEAIHAFLRIVERTSPALVRLEHADDSAVRSFLIQHRELPDEAELVFLSNQEGEHQATRFIYKGALCSLRNSLSVELLDLVTGETKGIPYTALEDGSVEVSLDFAPYEAHALYLSSREGAESASDSTALTLPASTQRPQNHAVFQLDCLADWELAAERDNVLRLGEFELTVNGAKAPVKVQPKTFIDQVADLAAQGERLPLHFRQPFGIPMEARVQYPANCRYEAEFIVEELPPTCKLLMERGAIAGNYSIRINGHLLPSNSFEQDIYYDYLNRSCDILPYLESGHNQVCIEVEAAEDWHGVVNTIYIIGDFGVAAGSAEQPARIITKPGVGHVTGTTQPGHPYYAGTVRLSQTFHLHKVPQEETFEIAFANWDPHFHDCAEVIVNGTSLGVRAWSPYRFAGSASILHEGDNEVAIRLTNTLIGMLEGKRFDYASHQLHDV